MRGRAIGAGVLAALGLLLLPGAIMANWATTQLVQTERFVSALAPLADDPVVQERIIVEVTALVDEQVDIDAVTAELLGGLGDALDLGPRAQAALDLVSAPIAAGVRSLVADVVAEVVRSDAFSAAWERSVAVLHTQSIRLLSGSPDSLLALDRDGTLSLPLGPIVADVREALVEQGVPFAAAIPDIDRAIVLAEVPNLALARVLFQVGMTVGLWLPWITAALLVGAVLLAPRRPRTLRALGFVGLGVTAALAVGFSLARTAITASVGPDSSAFAAVVFDAMTAYALSTVLALVALSLVVLLVAWWVGASGLAARTRAAVAAGLASTRDALGIDASPVTAALHAQRGLARAVLVVLAALPALLQPPLSVLSVLASALLASGLLVVLELLAVPPLPSESESESEPEPEPEPATPAAKPRRRTTAARASGGGAGAA